MLKTGQVVIEEWEKMSKSKHNGVDPNEILTKYGSDTTKLLILSDVSPQSDRKWNPEDSHKRIEGMQRKIWKLIHQVIELQKNPADKIAQLSKEDFQKEVGKIWDARNFYLMGANSAYRHTNNFATIQGRIQGLLGDLWTIHGSVKRDSGEFQRGLFTAIMLLAPMAPHFSSELFAGLTTGLSKKHFFDGQIDWEKSLFHQKWPELDENYNLKFNIKLNGELLKELPMAVWKVRCLDAEEAFNIACCDEKVQEVILPKHFEYKFSKEEDLQANLSFKVELTREEILKKRQEEKEAKKLKKLMRNQKKAEKK